MNPRVIVLGGGPDAEREVSLQGARAVAEALGDDATLVEIGPDGSLDLAEVPGDVILPILHGPWGEGGPLQRRLARDPRPSLGSGPEAAERAMDKLLTKRIAAELGLTTPEASEWPPGTPETGQPVASPIGLPCVVKPRCEGSSVGLLMCETEGEFEAAADTVSRDAALHPDREWMVERLVAGREITVGVLGDGPGGTLRPTCPIEIRPADGVYDFDAKYARSDTRYIVDPDLPEGVAEGFQRAAVGLCERLGVRHLARVDAMVPDSPALGRYTVLEVNTMPGFTPTSLLPMAVRAEGWDFPAFVRVLVRLAMESAEPTRA